MKKQWKIFLENTQKPQLDSEALKKRFFNVWQLLSQYPERINSFSKKVPKDRDENGDYISAFRLEDFNELMKKVQKANALTDNVRTHNDIIHLRSLANKIQSELMFYVDFLEKKFRKQNHPGINKIIDDLTHVSDTIYKLMDF
jgi:hypothetical protein